MAKQVSNKEAVERLKALIQRMQKVNKVAASLSKEMKSETEAEKYSE